MIYRQRLQIEAQKLKLEQQKNRLAAAKTILRLTEQKLHTRNLIKFGELIIKAKLNKLPVDALYGALLSINEQLENDQQIKVRWGEKANIALKKEQ